MIWLKVFTKKQVWGMKKGIKSYEEKEQRKMRRLNSKTRDNYTNKKKELTNDEDYDDNC